MKIRKKRKKTLKPLQVLKCSYFGFGKIPKSKILEIQHVCRFGFDLKIKISTQLHKITTCISIDNNKDFKLFAIVMDHLKTTCIKRGLR